MAGRYHPSLPGFLFLVLALVLPLTGADLMVNGDGDPARHLRHGEAILQQRDVMRADDFSFTKGGERFVGFEYGSQVLIAMSHRLGGTVGIVALSTLLIAGSLAMIAAWLVRRQVDPLLAALATLAAAILTNIHWLARPHLFSWPLMLLLLFWLESPRRPPLWAFGLLFLLWANLHGAFVFGWIIMGLYLAGHLIELLKAPDREVHLQQRAAAAGLVSVLGVAMAVTVINPYGWHLPWHVLGFFRDPWIPRLTQEFQSPDFLRHDRAFLLALMGTMVVLARRPRLPWTHLMVVLGTAGMALISSRNIVQFGLLAVPLITLSVADLWRHSAGRLGFVQRFAGSTRTGSTAPWVILGSVLLLALATGRGRLGGIQVVPEGFSPARFPVNAVTWARSNGVTGRTFHEFIWGGYLLQAWPENPVFIDGGTDHYTGAFMRAHRHVVTLQPGWRDSLAAWRIDWALLARESQLSAELLLTPGWSPVYCDSTAMLLRHGRPNEPTPVTPNCMPVSARGPGR